MAEVKTVEQRLEDLENWVQTLRVAIEGNTQVMQKMAETVAKIVEKLT